jgi:predicted dehydrogenase
MEVSADTAKAVRQWRYGLIGCGRFGQFCLEQLRGWEKLQPLAVTDELAALAEKVAQSFNLIAYATCEELLADPQVDMVLISTPPNTHYSLAMQALQAGKHVICEKPLALSTAQADELIATAHRTDRLLAVDHMLRYSKLLEAVRQIVSTRVLGEPLHYFFENYAADERLPADHWFWNPRQSGGIFIEHGVHFFDLSCWWFGPIEVLAAHVEVRPGTKQIDRAGCFLHHQNGVIGQHYHGFDQPARLDRADHRIVFTHGDVTVKGWIPMEMEIHGIVDDAQRMRLMEICRGCNLEILDTYKGPQQQCHGRGNQYHVTAQIRLHRQLTEDRGLVYGTMIRDLLADQLRVIEQSGHQPRLSAQDAREAVAVAEFATRLADKSGVGDAGTS